MKIFSLYIFLISVVFSQNKNPIVLIHGFFGWGNEELGDYKYWGGKNGSVQKYKTKLKIS